MTIYSFGGGEGRFCQNPAVSRSTRRLRCTRSQSEARQCQNETRRRRPRRLALRSSLHPARVSQIKFVSYLCTVCDNALCFRDVYKNSPLSDNPLTSVQPKPINGSTMPEAFERNVFPPPKKSCAGECDKLVLGGVRQKLSGSGNYSLFEFSVCEKTYPQVSQISLVSFPCVVHV